MTHHLQVLNQLGNVLDTHFSPSGKLSTESPTNDNLHHRVQ